MVAKTVLDNGTVVLSEQVPGFSSCSLGIWVKTGSRFENRQQAGLSHFIEHMLFKGTERRSAAEIAQVMDGVGAQMNAFTEKEHTCFYVRVIDKHFALAWDVLSDMFLHSAFAEEELEREKGVILEEINMYEDTPEDVAFELFHRTMWDGHPLGLPILGSREQVSAFGRDDFLRYMKDYYTANRLVVAAAGNVGHEDLVRRVEAWNLPASRAELNLTVGGVPAAKASKAVRCRDDEQVNLCLGAAGLAADDPRRYAMMVLDSVLGGSMSCRLFQEIREKRGLAYAVGTFQNSYRDCGSFGIYAGTSPENAEKVLQLSREVADAVCQDGITEAELDRAHEYIKGTLALGLESTSAHLMRLAKTECYHGRYIDETEFDEHIDSVTREDVLQVARELLAPERFHLAAVGPLRELDGCPAVAADV